LHVIILKQVYRRGYEKSALAARCCRVANDLTYFTGDRQTNKRTDWQTNRRTVLSRKSPAFANERSIGKVMTKTWDSFLRTDVYNWAT